MIAQPLPPPGSVTQALPLSFAQVYEQYRERIYRYIHRLVSDPEQAEDLTQETFTRAFKALSRMPAGLRVSPWLYRIATNVAYDALRRRKLIAWLALPDLEYEPAEVARADPQEVYGTVELVRTALRRMPEPYRAALVLYTQQGFSYQEIAQALHIAESGVKMYLSRARRQFKQHYLALEQEAAHV